MTTRDGHWTGADEPVRDLLGRSGLVEEYCAFLMSGSGASLHLVNGEWGSGKSVFLRMCAGELGRREPSVPRVLEFNAWKQGYTNNPLLDLTYFISSSLEESAAGRLKRHARLAARQVGLGVSGIVSDRTFGLVNLGAFFAPRQDPWQRAQRRMESFHRRLADVVEGGPLVLLIDDIERCEPGYAARLLEQIHFMFTVPGVYVVLAAQQDSLERSIRSVHGEQYPAARYLRSIITQNFELPHPPARRVSGLIADGLSEIAAAAGITEAELCDICDILALVPLCVYGGIRNIERVIGVASWRMPEMGRPDDPGSYHGGLTLGQVSSFAAAVAAVSLMSPAAYEHLLRRPTDGVGVCRQLHADLDDRLGFLYSDADASGCWRTLCTCLVTLGGTDEQADGPLIANEDLGASFSDTDLARMRTTVAELRSAHHRAQSDGRGVAAEDARGGIELPVRRWGALLSRAMLQG